MLPMLAVEHCIAPLVRLLAYIWGIPIIEILIKGYSLNRDLNKGYSLHNDYSLRGSPLMVLFIKSALGVANCTPLNCH